MELRSGGEKEGRGREREGGGKRREREGEMADLTGILHWLQPEVLTHILVTY